MKASSRTFKSQAIAALDNPGLQRALGRAKNGFVGKRAAAVAAFPDFAELRHQARRIKDHALAHLDVYLEQFEAQVQGGGGQVHWAETPEQACAAAVQICRAAGDGSRVIKGKSMVAEEIALNEALESAGLEVIETDLGEYIVQLAHEPPSHIIAPAVHKTREEIADLFHDHHKIDGVRRRHRAIPELVSEARHVLRQHFLGAAVGITGANFLVAETGSVVLVTNEGNGDLASTLPRIHIVVTSIEKIVATLDDATLVLRLLSRSATGQELSTYTSVFTGPRRKSDSDGPEQFHVILVDNGRSRLLGNEFRDILRCIRCGACLNHCPVYGAIGGHAYGWVYSGPMGAVLTPVMIGLGEAGDLPNASSLCGRCEEVCPMEIPLPRMLRDLRARQKEAGLVPRHQSLGLALWAFLAARPWLYRWVTRVLIGILSLWGRRRGRFARLPLAAGWTKTRDFPAPEGGTFLAAWNKGRREP